MSVIRPMLVELTGVTEYADGVGDDVDLTASGIDSGDLVRLVLLIEQRTGVEITAEDMEDLATIADYERFVAERGTVGSGTVGSGTVGSGTVGSGTVGSGTAGQGTVGQGAADPVGGA